MRGRMWTWALLGGAALLVLVGGGLLAWAPAPASFGWYAYAPLSDTTSTFSGSYSITPARAAGAGMLTVGLLLVAGWFGWILGRRSGLRAQR